MDADPDSTQGGFRWVMALLTALLQQEQQQQQGFGIFLQTDGSLRSIGEEEEGQSRLASCLPEPAGKPLLEPGSSSISNLDPTAGPGLVESEILVIHVMQAHYPSAAPLCNIESSAVQAPPLSSATNATQLEGILRIQWAALSETARRPTGRYLSTAEDASRFQAAAAGSSPLVSDTTSKGTLSWAVGPRDGDDCQLVTSASIQSGGDEAIGPEFVVGFLEGVANEGMLGIVSAVPRTPRGLVADPPANSIPQAYGDRMTAWQMDLVVDLRVHLGVTLLGGVDLGIQTTQASKFASDTSDSVEESFIQFIPKLPVCCRNMPALPNCSCSMAVLHSMSSNRAGRCLSDSATYASESEVDCYLPHNLHMLASLYQVGFSASC